MLKRCLRLVITQESVRTKNLLGAPGLRLGLLDFSRRKACSQIVPHFGQEDAGSAFGGSIPLIC